VTTKTKSYFSKAISTSLTRWKNLKANDLRFNQDVSLSLDDGSFFYFKSAFVEPKKEFYVVFPEHAIPFVVLQDSVAHIAELKEQITS
jgi:hypothetical protein